MTVNHRSNGQFAAGNKAANGNPNHKRMYELRKAVLDTEGPEEVKSVLLAMRLAAVEERDAIAARVYLDFTFSKPPQSVELITPEPDDESPLFGGVESLLAIVFKALVPHPEARWAVAAAMMQERREGHPDSPERGNGVAPTDGSLTAGPAM
jgi:hypothetical protein